MSQGVKTPARTRRVTALDVARRAGVSRSAVSRTFTDGASASVETRRRVVAAAAELGYHRNALVRGMINQRTGIIGIVTGRLDNPFIAFGLDILSRRLQRDGLRTLIYSGDAERDLKIALPSMIEYRIDGCFFLSNELAPSAAAEYASLDIPLVVVFSSYLQGISDHGGQVPVGAISVDNFESSRLVAEHLIEAGGTRFGFVSGLPEVASSKERQMGFEAGLARRGLALSAVDVGNFSYEGGCAAARRMLMPADRPDAIFCANDLMALGALDVARREAGLAVPAELLIAGFDGIDTAGYPSYNLTTVCQPASEMIEKAVELMLSLIREPSRLPMQVRVASRLVVRESTSRAGAAASFANAGK